MPRTPFALLKFVAKAALNAASYGLLGEFVVEVVPEFCHDIWDGWSRETDAAGRRAELEHLIRASDEEIRLDVDALVREIAAQHSESVREGLTTYLRQVPASIRQSQRRPDDPTGTSLRPGLLLNKAEDLIPVLPSKTTRFHKGDRPLPGTDWELVEWLGSGGFGEVWKARHLDLPGMRPVVLKFCTDPEARRLLKHEAEMIVRVTQEGRHPGIVALMQPYLSADPPCLQFEFVEGGHLAGLIGDWHAGGKTPDPIDVAKAMLEISRIVAFAHNLNPPIVHRDLKPANILISRANGKVSFRITDFGIGGLALAQARKATMRGADVAKSMTVGLRGSFTANYASPEQMSGGSPDPRDDVHALGVIWYQMITGSLTKGRPGGPKWIERFIGRGMSHEMVELLGSCFEEEQEDRPANAAILAETLSRLIDPAPVVEVVRETPKPPPIATPAPIGPSKKDVNSIGMKLKLILAGEFQMGSDEYEDEKPVHSVKVTLPFYLGVFQVTQAEYLQIVNENPSQFKCNDRLPVESVSWLDTIAFCNFLSMKEGHKLFYEIKGETIVIPNWTAAGYRLPTEAEWEYACRAGTTTRYSFGDDEARLAEHGWFEGNSGSETHPVGEKKPNPWRLHDMHGNVWEWCWDGYDENYYPNSPASDPRGPDSAASRVICGGSWNDDGGFCRSANRVGIDPTDRCDDVGFRVARFPSGG